LIVKNKLKNVLFISRIYSILCFEFEKIQYISPEHIVFFFMHPEITKMQTCAAGISALNAAGEAISERKRQLLGKLSQHRRNRSRNDADGISPMRADCVANLGNCSLSGQQGRNDLHVHCMRIENRMAACLRISAHGNIAARYGVAGSLRRKTRMGGMIVILQKQGLGIKTAGR